MSSPIALQDALPAKPWHSELTRYHWFVLVVCTMGWLFDCLTQQFFNMARRQAVTALIDQGASVDYWAGVATSFLLVGWATGGIIFGILGDRIGRAKTMICTILMFTLFTGLIGTAQNIWMFILFQFLTGLGVGGQFAVGVALVAETMPDRARAPALGRLQAFSAAGNITAAFIGMTLAALTLRGVIETYWRWLFAVGILFSPLALVVMSRLKEPERWKQAVADRGKTKQAGPFRQLFGEARWRRRAIVGIILAASGVVGLWGIGVFSNDLVQTVFRKDYQKRAREAGKAEMDRQFLQLVLQNPQSLNDEAALKIPPRDLLSLDAANKDPEVLYAAALRLRRDNQTVSPETVLAALDEASPEWKAQTTADRARRAEYLSASGGTSTLPQCIEAIRVRNKEMNGNLGWWAAFNLLFFNIGAFCGMYLFALVTQRIGRRPTFAIFFLGAMITTAMTFLYLRQWTDLLWMTPLMGAFQLSVFGGYAIYFPELFPTRMRATGTSVCYNTARYVAAIGPFVLGLLTTRVFAGFEEPMRPAGVTMCAFFLLGIAVLPFAPETKGQPLPE